MLVMATLAYHCHWPPSVMEAMDCEELMLWFDTITQFIADEAHN